MNCVKRQPGADHSGTNEPHQDDRRPAQQSIIGEQQHRFPPVELLDHRRIERMGGTAEEEDRLALPDPEFQNGGNIA